MPSPLRSFSSALLFAAAGTLAAQTVEWDGGSAGTSTSLTTLTAWNPDIVATTDLTDKILRIATANFDPATVTTTTGIGNILVGTLPQVGGFEFDNTGGYYRLNFGVRLVPTTSTTTTTDRIITFSTPGTIIKVTGNAAASIRRFSTNVGDSTGDLATMIVNLNYVGSGTINVEGNSTFLFQETKITGTGGITKTGPGTLTLDSGVFASLSAPPNLTVNTVYNGSTSDNYSGGLTILGGVVSVDSVNRLPSSTLNNDGVTPNPDAVVINGGTLRFSGGTLGSSVNRGFRVGAATGTLEITATNTRLIGPFRDVVGEAGVLVKTGAGNLSLENASIGHSGGTRLQVGTLTLNGGTLGAVGGLGLTASANVTLRGYGTINGASSFADGANIQPGTYAANAVTAAAGKLTFVNNLTLGDVLYAFDLDTPAASDQIAVSAGATLNIGAGLLDLSSFTFTAGAGFAPGFYPLIVSESAIVGSLAPVVSGTLGSQPLALAFSSDRRSIVLTVGNPSLLSAWRQTYFGSPDNSGNGLDSADPDQDGLSNLAEYALGALPLVADASPAPRAIVSNGRLALTFNRVADPALTYRVQASDTLAADSWTDVWTSTGSANVAGTVTAEDTETLSSRPRRFLRLNVTY